MTRDDMRSFPHRYTYNHPHHRRFRCPFSFRFIVTVPLCTSIALLSYWTFHQNDQLSPSPLPSSPLQPQHANDAPLPIRLKAQNKVRKWQDKLVSHDLMNVNDNNFNMVRTLESNANASRGGGKGNMGVASNATILNDPNARSHNTPHISTAALKDNPDSHHPQTKNKASSVDSKNALRTARRNPNGVQRNKHQYERSDVAISFLNAASLPYNHSTNKKSFVFWEAYGPNGETNYRMDPKALHKSRQRFLEQHPSATYQFILKNYYPNFIQAHWYERFCNFRGAKYPIEEDGFKLLTKKIRIATNYTIHHDNANAITRTTKITTNSTKHRILCGMYTHAGNHELARTAALTWGYKCDGFVAFSTETNPQLGMLHLQHAGPETYKNMWQKIRSIWAYIYHHYYKDEYDYFHLCGDDVLLIVENLRRFLHVHDQSVKTDDQAVFLGQWRLERNYSTVVGGAGYTLNRVALRRLVEELLPVCAVDVEKAAEDYIISYCFRWIGILPGDTRDPATGEQMYHSRSPLQLFTARAGMLKLHGHRGEPGNSAFSDMKRWWESLPHPSNPNQKVGPKDELEAAAMYSVAFHNLKTPLYIAMANAIIYETCEKDSRMGQSVTEAKGEAQLIVNAQKGFQQQSIATERMQQQNTGSKE